MKRPNPSATEHGVSRLTAWLVTATVVVIVAIQVALPDALTRGYPPVIPVLEILGLPLGWLMRSTHHGSRRRRAVVGTWAVLLVTASILNAAMMLIGLLTGFNDIANLLLLGGFGVLAINVLSFGLIYWWLDGGGPRVRPTGPGVLQRDFLFPQEDYDHSFQPVLGDYYYTSYTNVIAFSPTDTMPLTQRAKLLFTIQSAVALLTITVTLSVAVNLFN